MFATCQRQNLGAMTRWVRVACGAVLCIGVSVMLEGCGGGVPPPTPSLIPAAAPSPYGQPPCTAGESPLGFSDGVVCALNCPDFTECPTDVPPGTTGSRMLGRTAVSSCVPTKTPVPLAQCAAKIASACTHCHWQPPPRRQSGTLAGSARTSA